MKKRKIRQFAVPLFLLALILAADQISKSYVHQHIKLGAYITVIKDFAYITYTDNTGISFGLFKGLNPVFIVLSFIVLFFFIYTFFAKKNYRLMTGIIIAGIIGNVIDRMIYGYVIDFIQIGVFPIFNIADSAIFVGMMLLIIQMTRLKEDII